MKFSFFRQMLPSFAFLLLMFGCSKDLSETSKNNSLINGISNSGAQVENTPAGGRVIKDAYIVVFKDDVADVDQLTDALSKQGGFKSKFRYKHAIKGFSASIPAQALEGIRRNPNVKYIEQDQEVKLESTTQGSATWGLDRIDQTSLPLSNTYVYTKDGATVDAYIYDTGILFGHEEFDGTRAKFGYDAFGGNGSDGNGHGTHVAGTVGGTKYGVAKKTTLYAVRVLDNSGSGSWSGVAAGVDWSVGHHAAGKPAVGNMSLGGGASTAVDDAVRRAVADGIVMCVAAGNSNADAINSSPARTAEAITVGSTTSTDAKSSFSNFGSIIDIHAPGSSITSAWHTGTTAINTISGTSMAAPHVAGAAALYLEEFPGSNPAAVQTGLKNRAVVGKISGLPSGTVNALLQTILPPPPTVPPAIPTLNSPAAGATAIATSLTFSWSAASNAQTYTLEVSTSSDFSSGVQTFNTSNTSQAVSGLSQATVYHWRVKANNVLGSSTSLSRSFTTLISAPTLSSPNNGATNVSRTPTLSWSSVAAANGYDIQVSTSSNFSSGITNYTSVTNTIIISPALSARITYYWRVRAKRTVSSTTIATSGWSGSRRFTTSN